MAIRLSRRGGVCIATLCLALCARMPSVRAESPLEITISASGCEPSSVTVAPGRSVFKIRNASTRVVEWEILKGAMVQEERENIVPGFTQTISARLEEGEYAITCGLLSNPRGVLKVVATPNATSGAAFPSPMELVGPLSEYKVYVIREVAELKSETRRFSDAVKAGRLDEAKALYAPTRQHYERVEPIAELFNDLDSSMDSRENDFEKKAEDPAFTGFHRIEKALFADHTTAGMEPLADKLLSDVTELDHRVGTLVITPKHMAGGAARLIEEVASKKIVGEEDRYSRTDLWDFRANIDGAQTIVGLLEPLVARTQPDLTNRVRQNFSKIDAILDKYRDPQGGFVSYERLSDPDRNRLKGPITILAEDLSMFRGALGID